MRTVLIAIVAASVAAMAGALAMAQFYRPQLQTSTSQVLALQREVDSLHAREIPDTAGIESRAQRAEADYAALLAETQRLREENEQLKAGKAELETAADARPGLDDIDAVLDAAPGPEEADRERRRGRDDWNSPEREAERAARFQEFRASVDEFMANELANATDPETIERLEAMNVARNNLFDLREARRNAQTDEERASLEAQADDARDVLDGLMKEQQQAMINQVGRDFGIKGENLRAFRQNMRAVLESPYFRFGGGGPPGAGRGGGGPNRRGPESQ